MEQITLTFSLSKNSDGIYCIRNITFDQNTTDLKSDSQTLEKISAGLQSIFSNPWERSRLYGQDILNRIDFDEE